MLKMGRTYRFVNPAMVKAYYGLEAPAGTFLCKQVRSNGKGVSDELEFNGQPGEWLFSPNAVEEVHDDKQVPIHGRGPTTGRGVLMPFCHRWDK